MGKNTLVINCDIGETRVALIENGILSELHLERRGQKGLVGNIYLGKVSRVLPGMQAAFIDIGEERAAFLHVEDLIRPADFEAYLSGSKRREAEPIELNHAAEGADSDPPSGPELSIHAEAAAESDVDLGRSTLEDIRPNPVEEPDAPVLRQPTHSPPPPPLESSGESSSESNGELRDTDDVVHKNAPKDVADMAVRRGRRRRGGRSGVKRDEIATDERAEGDVSATATTATADSAATNTEDDSGPPSSEEPRPESRRRETVLVGDQGTADGALVESSSRIAIVPESSPRDLRPVRALRSDGDPPRAPFGRGDGRDRNDRGGGRGAGSGVNDRGDRGPRGRGRGPGGGDRNSGGARPADRNGQQPSSHGRSDRADRGDRAGLDRGHGGPRRDARDGGLRLGRSTPINEVVKEGQEVIVQVTKDPIGTKGARVSSHVSLPGRYVVYMPTVEHVGVSRRIGSDNERRRLREAIDAMKPPQGGLIVRTLAEGLTKKQLKADVGYLVRLWGEIAKKKEVGSKAPCMLFQELDVVLRTARDMFTDDVEKIVIDDREQFHRLQRFIEMFMPERASAIELYTGDEPIFDAYGLEDEIARALSRKVPLPSGGYLIIDQAEALTAIDVNSGRFVGKGNKDPEDTILQTNMEAVQEIAYQLRFRNIGGLIVLDLIDMERHSNREKVYRALEQALLADKAKTSINRISELGLVEMTRKRTRESLGRTLHEACFYCDGTGQLQSRATVAFEILRQIRRERMSLAGYKVIVNAHPSVIDYLQTEERDVLKEAERRYERQIMLVPHKEYHLEQFDLTGR